MSRTRNLLALVALFIIVVLLEACSPCAKLAKRTVVADKDSAAFCFYRKRQYESAALLFEELLGYYRGSPRYETILFQFGMTKFKLNDFTNAAFFFQQYVDQFSQGPMAEEAAYKVAESYFRMSNIVELDQGETVRAIEYMELYQRQYPNSDRSVRGYDLVREMKGKLSRKAYNQADLYYKLGHHKAAVVAYRNLLQDYPDTPFREEVLFKTLKAAVLLADNSVGEKMEQRYEDATTHYLRFIERYPQSRYQKEAQSLYAYTQKRLEALRNPLVGPKQKEPRRNLRDVQRVD